ncbi:hypothetical protein SNE40_004712 [Patella caerulea]|uniref:DDE Tnp4 domain-containing protein n=1 Tax=Patella caerulea TaxID=87958 RepID=A0AAN8K3K9_PATCE
MDPAPRNALVMLFQQHQNQLLQVQQALDVRRRVRRRQRRVRAIWVRQWINRRPQLGLYDRLMVELRNEDPRAFKNFMRMPPVMYDELVERLTPTLTKETTNWRAPLDPGLKVAITLRHLASGSKYREMQYGWRVPHNTISLIVREVCEAIVHVYREEMLSPPETPEQWQQITDDWLNRWNFPHVIGAIDGKHIACKAPPNSGSEFYNYKGFFSIILSTSSVAVSGSETFAFGLGLACLFIFLGVELPFFDFGAMILIFTLRNIDRY